MGQWGWSGLGNPSNYLRACAGRYCCSKCLHFVLDPEVGAGTNEGRADERDGLRRAAVGPAGLPGSSSLPSVSGGIGTQAPGQGGGRPHQLQPVSTFSSRRCNAPNDMMA